jgi:hypothetical protein
LHRETAFLASKREGMPSFAEVKGALRKAREQGMVVVSWARDGASTHTAPSQPQHKVNGPQADFCHEKELVPGAAPGGARSMQGQIFLNFVPRIP